MTFPPSTGDYDKDCEAGRAVFNEAYAKLLQDKNIMPLVMMLEDAEGLALGHRVGFNTALVSALLP